MIEDDLVDFLPEWQRIFIHFPSYHYLCKCLEEFINCKPDKFSEKQSEFIHAKMVFDDLCDKDPESIKEKLTIENVIALKQRNEDLDLNYRKHQQFIKKEVLK